MARRTNRTTSDQTATTTSKPATSSKPKATTQAKATAPAKAAPAPVVTAPAKPAPVVTVSTVHVPARGRSYTYPALGGDKPKAGPIINMLLVTGATESDLAAALVHYMPSNYAAIPDNAVKKVQQHLSWLRGKGAVLTNTAGVWTCPNAKDVQIMARGGNRA